jgi:hypothetical protein
LWGSETVFSGGIFSRTPPKEEMITNSMLYMGPMGRLSTSRGGQHSKFLCVLANELPCKQFETGKNGYKKMLTMVVLGVRSVGRGSVPYGLSEKKTKEMREKYGEESLKNKALHVADGDSVLLYSFAKDGNKSKGPRLEREGGKAVGKISPGWCLTMGLHQWMYNPESRMFPEGVDALPAFSLVEVEIASEGDLNPYFVKMKRIEGVEGSLDVARDSIAASFPRSLLESRKRLQEYQDDYGNVEQCCSKRVKSFLLETDGGMWVDGEEERDGWVALEVKADKGLENQTKVQLRVSDLLEATGCKILRHAVQVANVWLKFGSAHVLVFFDADGADYSVFETAMTGRLVLDCESILGALGGIELKEGGWVTAPRKLVQDGQHLSVSINMEAEDGWPDDAEEAAAMLPFFGPGYKSSRAYALRMDVEDEEGGVTEGVLKLYLNRALEYGSKKRTFSVME